MTRTPPRGRAPLSPGRRTLGLALLAFAFLPVAGGQTASPAGPDLAIERVAFDGLPPQVVDGVARSATLLVTVRNDGEVAVSGYQLAYWWSQAGAQRPLNGDDPTASLDVREERLEPRTNRTHSFRWTLQPGQTGDGAVQVQVHLGGQGGLAVDRDPGDNHRTLPVRVDVHAFMAGVVGEPLQVHPAETVFARVEVRNQGNVPSTYALAPSAGDDNPLVAEADPPLLAVGPGEVGHAVLYLTYPADADAVAFQASPTVRVTPVAGAAQTVAAPKVESTFEPYAPADHALWVGDARSSPFATAQAPATASWTLRNDGLQQDVVRIEVAAPAGWAAAPLADRVALDAGGQVTVHVRATPPHDAPQGTRADLVVRMASVHPEDPVVVPFTARVGGPAPHLEAATVPGRTYVGDAIDVPLEATNLGDQALDEGRLTVEATVPGAPRREIQLDTPRLAPGAVARLEVPLGTAAHGGTVAIAATWRVGDAALTLLREVQVREPRVTLTAAQPTEGVPGEAVLYAHAPHVFRIRNDGADAETFAFVAAASDGVAELAGPATLSLQPGEERSVPVRQVLPAATPGGRLEVPLTLTARLADRPQMAWQASVPTKSVDRVAPEVGVALRPSAWAVGDPLPVGALVRDGSGIRSASLEVVGPHANRTLALTQAGAWWNGTLVLATAGNHTLRVSAVDDAGNIGLGPVWTLRAVAGPVPRIEPLLGDNRTAVQGALLPVRVLGASGPSLGYELRQAGTVLERGNATLRDGHAELSLAKAAPGVASLWLSAPGRDGSAAAELVVDFLVLHNGTAAGEASADVPPGPQGAPGAGVALAAAALGVCAALRRRRP